MKETESKSKKELLEIKTPNYDYGNKKLSKSSTGKVEGWRETGIRANSLRLCASKIKG